MSGFASFRSNMLLRKEDTIEILEAAGFRARHSGDLAAFEFRESRNSLLIRDAQASTRITFTSGRIDSVSPGDRYRIDGVELSGIYTNGATRRTQVQLDEISQDLLDAIIAVEDHRFFDHIGVDVIGIVRSLAHNLKNKPGLQGGSTLTQQLAKNLFLSPERTWRRKIRELFIALALEHRLTKEQILELYVNQIYLGQVNGIGIGGVDQAARVYFGKTAATLNLSESAMLAGLISAPNYNSPVRHLRRAIDRRNIALMRMLELGVISSFEKSNAIAYTPRIARKRDGKSAPWAVDYALETLDALHGIQATSNASIQVRTTIDISLQRIAEKAVGEGMQVIREGASDAQVAMIAVDARNGDILAMVGGYDYRESTFNRAVYGRRHIGSTVKGLTWLFAYASDPTLKGTTSVPDIPISFPEQSSSWSPRNHDDQFLGAVSVTDALTQSRNIPAINMAQGIGFKQLSAMLNRVGLTDATEFPSVALGAFEASPMDLCGAYTVFPGDGGYVQPRILRSVRMPDGTEGVEQSIDIYRAANSRAAFLATKDLYKVVEVGTGRRVRSWVPNDILVGGKTGTTDKERDAWFVGFVGYTVIAVWVGVDKGKPLGMSGAEAAIPIWSRFVAAAGLDSMRRPAPKGVVRDSMCVESNMVANSSCTDVTKVWHQDGEVQGCTLHTRRNKHPGAFMDSLRRKIFGRKNKQPERQKSR